MFRFKDAVLPFDRSLPNSFKKIYGIGFERAVYVSNLFGFSYRYSINRLNYYFFECMVAIMKIEYSLEDRLKFTIRNRFSIFRDASLVKVKRYDAGLPTRGQRTHSNAKTLRRNRIF